MFSSHSINLVCAVGTNWALRYGDVLRGYGDAVVFVDGGAELADRLARDWTVDVVILDLALATPALGARLGPGGPRLLAFGDPEHAGIALQANLADFIAAAPSDKALLSALDAALPAAEAAGVADMSSRTSGRREARDAETGRIAAALARLGMGAVQSEPAAIPAAAVRALIRARRARERFLPADIFGDPAWDMLLDLTAARLEGRSVAVSSLCIAAAVPTTTALRWVRNLCDAGLFERRGDPGDARRAFIGLAEPTARAMLAYLATVREVAVV